MVRRVVKLALLAGAIGLIGVLMFRPAALLGVEAKALANSLANDVHHADATCAKARSGRWRCTLEGGKVDGVEYELTTHGFGCWGGSKVAQPRSDAPAGSSVSGCIGLIDQFGG